MSRVIINYCMVCDKPKLMPDKDTSICGECHAKLIMMGCDVLLLDISLGYSYITSIREAEWLI